MPDYEIHYEIRQQQKLKVTADNAENASRKFLDRLNIAYHAAGVSLKDKVELKICQIEQV